MFIFPDLDIMVKFQNLRISRHAKIIVVHAVILTFLIYYEMEE